MNFLLLLLVANVANAKTVTRATHRFCNVTFCSKCAKLLDTGDAGNIAIFCRAVTRIEACCGKHQHAHI